MNISIINKSSYNIILMKNNNVMDELGVNSTVSLDVRKCDTVTFCPKENNHVYFNFLFALIDGFISEDSVVNSLICYEDIYFSEVNDDCIIEIYDFECRLDEKGFIYDTVKIIPYGTQNIQISYHTSPIVKEYRKTKLFLCLISSWIPIIIGLFVLYLITEKIYFIFGMIALFLGFSIPSFIKVKRLKKYYSDDFVNKSIILELEKENSPPQKNIFNTIIDNTVTNIMDNIFKKH